MLDAATVDRIYRSHGHLVLRRARRLLGNEDDAREVVHEVFVSLLVRPPGHWDERRPTPWLYAATTHGCLNRLRNVRTRARLLVERQDAPRSGEGLDPESASILRDLMSRVPPPLVEIAVYYYVDEMTQAEIALVLGCSRRRVGDLVERLHASLLTLEQAT